jgi:hypothetical protein
MSAMKIKFLEKIRGYSGDSLLFQDEQNTACLNVRQREYKWAAYQD